MKNKIKIVLALLALIIYPNYIYASCESDFQAIQDKFKASYKYNKDSDDFTLTFTNPSKDRYAFASEDRDNTSKTSHFMDGAMYRTTISNYKKEKFHYAIFATYNGCDKVKVFEKTIELKKYNPYADDPRCEGKEEFALCQKEYEKEIDEKTFASRLETYINSQEKADPNNYSNNYNSSNNNKKSNSNSSQESSFFDKIITFVTENVIEIIVVTIFIVILTIAIVLKVRTEMKSRRLE